MHRLRRWVAMAAVAGGLCGLGFACQDGEAPPSAEERQARSALLRELIASRERPPDPDALEAQRRELHAEVEPGERPAHGGSGLGRPAASVLGTVVWVGDDELLVRDTGGVEREVLVEDGTRFVREGRQVSRRRVEKGAQVRISYGVEQEEWVAREVELIREPAPRPRSLRSEPRSPP